MISKKKCLVSGFVGLKTMFPTTDERNRFHDWLFTNAKKITQYGESGTFEITVLTASKEEAYQIFLKKLPKYVAVNEDTCKIEEVK